MSVIAGCEANGEALPPAEIIEIIRAEVRSIEEMESGGKTGQPQNMFGLETECFAFLPEPGTEMVLPESVFAAMRTAVPEASGSMVEIVGSPFALSREGITQAQLEQGIARLRLEHLVAQQGGEILPSAMNFMAPVEIPPSMLQATPRYRRICAGLDRICGQLHVQERTVAGPHDMRTATGFFIIALAAGAQTNYSLRGPEEMARAYNMLAVCAAPMVIASANSPLYPNGKVGFACNRTVLWDHASLGLTRLGCGFLDPERGTPFADFILSLLKRNYPPILPSHREASGREVLSNFLSTIYHHIRIQGRGENFTPCLETRYRCTAPTLKDAQADNLQEAGLVAASSTIDARRLVDFQWKIAEENFREAVEKHWQARFRLRLPGDSRIQQYSATEVIQWLLSTAASQGENWPVKSLRLIEERVNRQQTGADWLINQRLRRKGSWQQVRKDLAIEMSRQAKAGPVAEWD